MANDFLVFNPAGNNALSQASYNANSARLNGITPGIAPKELYNKLFLQVSTMSAALGEIMNDYGLDASDSNFTALKTALENAFLSMDRILPPVVNLAALKAINTTLLPSGVSVNTKGLGNFYLDPDSTATPNDTTIVQPTVGTGRWLISGANTFEKRIYNLTMTRSGKDVNDLYMVVTHKRPDATNYSISTLSGGTSPEYTTRTLVYYAEDGVTVTDTKVFTLSYTDGELTSEVVV